MKKNEMSDLAQIKVDLRNKTTMYENAKNRISILKDEKKKLKEKNQELENKMELLKQELENKNNTILEYKRMIFRNQKKDKQCDENNQNTQEIVESNEKIIIQRTKESYTRKIPDESKITHIREAKIYECRFCKTPLKNIKKIERYVEDIDFNERTSKVTKYEIYSGFCPKCNKQISADNIPKAMVMFGERIRMFINFCITVMKLSYESTKIILKTLYKFEISDGEIRNILQREAEILVPEYNSIKENIQSQFGVHFDETGWNVQSEEERNYGWCMTGTENNNVCYDLGISRGAGEVDILGGIEENKTHIGITDGYAGYTNKFDIHQLCWAHPYRKLRDLTESKHFEKDKLERCEITYKLFGELYKKVRDEEKLEQEKIENSNPSTIKQREKLVSKLVLEFDKIVKNHKNDPEKLKTYKNTLAKYRDKYFVCLMYPGIPSDNNKAERVLRHLVLKRKNCYGSKTISAAAFMSINYSVLLSIFFKHPKDFFSDYSYVRNLYFTDSSIDSELRKELKI